MSTNSRGRFDRQSWTAFEDEVLPHLDHLFRFAVWFEGNRAEAEDLVQQTMVEALKSFHRFKAGTNCYAWLISILRHLRGHRQRALSRSLVVSNIDDRIAETVPFVPPVPQHLTDEDVLAAVRRIPLEHQEVILLCDIDELTYKEIATALTIPIGTVMSRLHRGRVLLRNELSAQARDIRRGA